MSFFRILLSFSCFVLFCACGPDKNTARIEGHIDGVNQATIMAYVGDATAADGGGMDSIRIERGKFSYDRPLTEPVVLTLLYPNFSSTTVVAEPGKTVSLSGDANRLKEIELKGTKDNELLTELRLRLAKKSPNDAEMEVASFIRSHPQTMAAVAAFIDHFDGREQYKREPALTLLNLLHKSQPANAYLVNLRQRILPLLQTSVGSPLPTFSATTLDGVSLTNESLKGKPALIVFTASWDGENYILRQSMSRVRRTLAAKVNTMVLSLDSQKADVERQAERDSLKNVIYAKDAFATPLVKTFGVRTVPGNVLTDARGRIVATNVPTDKFVDELSKYVK